MFLTGQSSDTYFERILIRSILAQDVALLLEYASSPVASHLLDAALSSHAVSPKYRRKLLSAFLGHYRVLAEDRMGSRVADTCWAKADGFMKVCWDSDGPKLS